MAPPNKPEPGRDAGMAERARKLNVVFALTSLVLLFTFSYMIWADYDREWKKYQKAFNRLEVQATRAQAEEALGKVDAARREALERELAKGRQEADARRDDIAKAEQEKGELDGRWYAVDQNYRFTKAEIDVARYEYEEAVAKKRDAEAAGQRLQDLEKRWAELRVELEEVLAARAAIEARIAGLEATRLQAEKTQKELFGEYDRLNVRLQAIQPGFVSFVRNMPLLDLANPSLKVNQVMPAHLVDDVVFTGTPKVDRCTTCHLGIDKRGYEDAPQPFTTHPDLELYLQGAHALERMGCTSCHGGRGRGTTFVSAVHTPSTAEQEKAWAKYSGGGEEYHRLHYWDYPMVAKGNTEANCVKCHQNEVEVPQAASLNAGRLLIERYGCYGCHKIKGWEGIRKVGPDLSKILAKTDEDWMYRWIKEPKAFRPSRMPQVWDVRTPDQETPRTRVRNDVEANAVVAYLSEKSSRQTYPEPPAGDLAAGRETFESVGCLGCHRVGEDRRGVDATLRDGTTKKGFAAASYRTHGPNLDGTGSKVSAGWLYSWIQDPRDYWHETRMPKLRLSAKEAADVTAYLMSLENEEFMARPRPGIDPGLRDEIIREHLLAANVPVREAEKQIAAMDDHQRTLFVGEKTIGRYGCFGCHAIPGFEQTSPIGVELTEEGSKLVERLDFGYEHGRIPHTLPAWVHLKVMEPRIYDRGKVKRPEELLRMPKFWVSEEEASAIVTAVMSMTKDQVPLAAQKPRTADDHFIQEGARLVRDMNCRGCHVLGQEGGSIQAVVADQLAATGVDSLTVRSQTVAFSPPTLYNDAARIGEGARVQTEWLHNFLLDPSEEVRPWVSLRMPTFEFTPEQLNVVTRYFASLDEVPFPFDPKPQPDPAKIAAGRDLFERWQCVKCHVVAGRLPDQPPENMAPDLAEVPRRLRAAWLHEWLRDPGKIQPGTRMPSVFPEKAEENAYPEILGGDQRAQIEAVTQYLMTLGQPLPAAATAASAPGGRSRGDGTPAGGASR